jgi:hypothetical protein
MSKPPTAASVSHSSYLRLGRGHAISGDHRFHVISWRAWSPHEEPGNRFRDLSRGGYFDDEACRLEPIENPFGPKVLPMCSPNVPRSRSGHASFRRSSRGIAGRCCRSAGLRHDSEPHRAHASYPVAGRLVFGDRRHLHDLSMTSLRLRRRGLAAHNRTEPFITGRPVSHHGDAVHTMRRCRRAGPGSSLPFPIVGRVTTGGGEHRLSGIWPPTSPATLGATEA